MAYEPLGAGLASAGQSIAAGIQTAEDRKWREKVFEENKRQFEVGQEAAARSANMKAGAELLDRLQGIYKEGGDPEGLNQMAQVALDSMTSGKPLDFDAIARLQQAQQNLQAPQQEFEQGPQGFMPTAQQQMQADIGTPFQAPELPRQIGLQPEATLAPMPLPQGTQPTFAPQPRVSPLSPAYEPPRIFPTLYDRVSTVPNPKAVQVKALKPMEQIRLFREKPINFDNAVKDGLDKGYVTPALAGEYYEAKLLGKSDEELAGIMKRMWREQPLSADERAKLGQSKDALKAAQLRDYTELIKAENDIVTADANLTKEFQDTMARLEIEGGKDVMSDPAVLTIRDEYDKQKQKMEKRMTRIGQAKTNYGHAIKKIHGIDLESIPNLQEAQKYFKDRMAELARTSAPVVSQQYLAEIAAKEALERFGVDVMQTREPQPEATTEDEKIDQEFDQVILKYQKQYPDRNRAGLAAVQELRRKYPNNQFLKDSEAQLLNMLRTK